MVRCGIPLIWVRARLVYRCVVLWAEIWVGIHRLIEYTRSEGRLLARIILIWVSKVWLVVARLDIVVWHITWVSLI